MSLLGRRVKNGEACILLRSTEHSAIVSGLQIGCALLVQGGQQLLTDIVVGLFELAFWRQFRTFYFKVFYFKVFILKRRAVTPRF